MTELTSAEALGALKVALERRLDTPCKRGLSHLCAALDSGSRRTGRAG